ncbi:hypothetical protein QNI19_09130 [Cytophagaceae bacterium DM2B3-1]|uniref:SMI1/KNR4 family protein n=1 Tax=Xanthocytophaga flava TaxID=3048013 RepID=A0ABT7CH82_9BACT|nr:hypothetical protein [Xanthocytophaga flavus]MDJ1493094.1 hypothetical protein [Xanthocytophaga flavus]
MKQQIINRIQQLGGNTERVKGHSLKDDILSITFNTVLYQRPIDTPWQKAEEAEPIIGIGSFIDANKELFEQNKQAFYDKIIDHYYRITQEGHGQAFWSPQLFTPFREGTDDFTEWNDWFQEDDVDLNEIVKLTNVSEPDFIALLHSYGFPDSYYICLSDPEPENPTLFGTDHEVFFSEVTNEGSLEDFLNACLTKEELIELIRKRLE